MGERTQKFEVMPEWVHIAYPESSEFRDVYGFTGSQGMVNLEGVRYVQIGRAHV